MRRTAMALGPAGNEVLSVLNSAFIQTSSLGRRDYRTPQPSRKGSRSFVPSPCRWVSEVEGLADLGLRVDLVRGLADRLTESKREAAARLESAVHAFNLAAITPHWPQIEVYAAAGRTAAAALMAERGVEESLSNIHPAISWQAPVLTVTIGDECPPGCVHRKLQSALPREISWIADGRGLVLVPSVFFPAPTLRVPGPEEDEPVVITFPVVTDWHAFAATEGSEKRNPLADLMGSTRALVLETLADGPHSTSGLSRRLHLSVASASEHAGVLRASKLVNSVREDNQVIHSLSAMGCALLRSTTTLTTIPAPVGHPGLGHYLNGSVIGPASRDSSRTG